MSDLCGLDPTNWRELAEEVEVEETGYAICCVDDETGKHYWVVSEHNDKGDSLTLDNDKPLEFLPEHFHPGTRVSLQEPCYEVADEQPAGAGE